MIANVIRATALLVAPLLGVIAAPAVAEDLKEKPLMFTYEASWVLPRASWAEMEKVQSDPKRTEKQLATPGIIAMGTDSAILHNDDTATQDGWFQAMSMAALLHVLEQIGQPGQTPVVFNQATKHWDNF